jgi:hypothetical protein
MLESRGAFAGISPAKKFIQRATFLLDPLDLVLGRGILNALENSHLTLLRFQNNG